MQEAGWQGLDRGECDPWTEDGIAMDPEPWEMGETEGDEAWLEDDLMLDVDLWSDADPSSVSIDRTGRVHVDFM